jgi:hypothetical protein
VETGAFGGDADVGEEGGRADEDEARSGLVMRDPVSPRGLRVRMVRPHPAAQVLLVVKGLLEARRRAS